MENNYYMPDALRDRMYGKSEGKAANIVIWVMLILLVVVVLLKAFVFQTVYVSGDSMDPTLKDGDYLIGNKLSVKFGAYKYGDIVVIDTDEKNPDGTNKKIIKRIIGLPGDEIDIYNGQVFRNGEALDESYLPEGTKTVQHSTFMPHKVNEGEVFVLGDNRLVSKDSRYTEYAALKISQIFAVIPNWSVKYKGVLTGITFKTSKSESL